MKKKDSLKLIERLKGLRDASVEGRLFKTAIFYAQQLVFIENNHIDQYKLSNIYYLDGKYHLCLHSLNQLLNSCHGKLLAAQCLVKMENYEEAMKLLSDSDEPIPTNGLFC